MSVYKPTERDDSDLLTLRSSRCALRASCSSARITYRLRACHQSSRHLITFATSSPSSLSRSHRNPNLRSTRSQTLNLTFLAQRARAPQPHIHLRSRTRAALPLLLASRTSPSSLTSYLIFLFSLTNPEARRERSAPLPCSENATPRRRWESPSDGAIRPVEWIVAGAKPSGTENGLEPCVDGDARRLPSAHELARRSSTSYAVTARSVRPF